MQNCSLVSLIDEHPPRLQQSSEPLLVTYQKIRYRISTSTLLGEVAQALRATSGTPAMVVERINYNQHGELIDCDIEYWRHDAISIESVAELN